MSSPDVLVLGGGIAGATFAWHAARAGRSVQVVEKDDRVGGCLHSVTNDAGYWIELGAHTCYNSYGGFLETLEGCGLLGELEPRGKPVLRFLDDGELVPGQNMTLLLKLFSKLELLRALPRWLGANAAGHTVREHYGRLVGAKNYDRVLGPMLSAVPSQPAHDFPADMLFKKRPRRKDVRRSFTLPGGLQTAVQRLLDEPGVQRRTGVAASGLARTGTGFAATLADGETIEAGVVAIATPPGAAARLLGQLDPALAGEAARVNEVTVDTLGFVARADASPIPYSTFLIPLDDCFHSVVTRDVVPDPDWRGFTFHFKPGLTRDEQVARATAVLRVRAADLELVGERATVLPSPRRGHADLVRLIDERLADGRLAAGRLALTGNWFGGLAIEDCALRSRGEWARVAALA